MGKHTFDGNLLLEPFNALGLAQEHFGHATQIELSYHSVFLSRGHLRKDPNPIFS
jgi:hypothetical protein